MTFKTLDIENFNLSIPTGAVRRDILNHVHFSLHKGKITALIGRSGSGKSQLAQSIINLNPLFVKAGIINININNQYENILLYTDAELIKLRKKHVSFIFQDALQSLNPTIKCFDQLTEYLQMMYLCTKSKARLDGEMLLQQVNLDYKKEVIHKYPHQLSGGQLQRLCIAMAFASPSEIIIADEITSSLDKNNAVLIYQLLKKHCVQKNKSLLLISHDMEAIKEIADEIYVISDGKIVEFGSRDVLIKPQSEENKKLLTSVYKKKPNIPEEELILEIKNLNIGYRHSSWSIHKKHVVKNFNLSIKKGEKVAVVGESGIGKSTIAKAICNLVEIDNGEIHWKVGLGNKNAQMIFQNPYSSCNPKMTILDILKEPFEINKIPFENKELKHLLNKVDLEESILHRHPKDLSGGQLQRICIARALITNPKLLIMDEALSSLDNVTKVEILESLDKIVEESKMSILFISHDLNLASSFCHSIIELK